MTEYAVVLVVALLGVALVASAAGVRRMLAPSHVTAAKTTTYESGVDPIGDGWSQGSLRYLIFAFLYVVFAVDAVYLFPWALILRTELGLASLIEMGIFIGVLALGLAHAWRRGLLRWW
ncbi:MAG: NADH-quinone oxidoreductase subunit A [Ornithinimicrobium sp.]